jgi:hypothetical protein
MTTYLLQGHTGKTIRARELAGDRPFRAPHYTISERSIVAELALAAGGVLYLDDVLEMSVRTVKELVRVWERMHSEHRPDLVLGIPLVAPDTVNKRRWAARQQHVLTVLPNIDVHEVCGLTPAQAAPFEAENQTSNGTECAK